MVKKAFAGVVIAALSTSSPARAFTLMLQCPTKDGPLYARWDPSNDYIVLSGPGFGPGEPLHLPVAKKQFTLDGMITQSAVTSVGALITVRWALNNTAVIVMWNLKGDLLNQWSCVGSW